MRHIIPISGKDSLATAIIQTTRAPEYKYEFLFNPTGQEYPEVVEWLERVEKYFDQPIIRVGRDLKQIIAEQNWFLPSSQARYCTRMAKIEPMEGYLKKEPSTIYFGIRADEDRGGYDNSSTPSITPAYPLKELGITKAMVYQINAHAGIKPPTFFWQWLWNETTKSIPAEYITAHLKEWQIDELFAWRTRSNCANCFFQRQYEWVGLFEHYPKLFWEYESWEHNVSEYYFLGQNKPLTWLVDNMEPIKQRRLKFVLQILSALAQCSLFPEDRDAPLDILNITSCGLYCGK